MFCVSNLLKARYLTEASGQKLAIVISQLFPSYNKEISLDFAQVTEVQTGFFPALLFPLIAEFGLKAVVDKLRLVNISNDYLTVYADTLKISCSNITKTSNQHITDERITLTVGLLVNARELLRQDPESAKIIFGLDRGMCELLEKMDAPMMLKIANTGLVCFRPRLSAKFLSSVRDTANEIDYFLNQAAD
jgi:hypothetical protein